MAVDLSSSVAGAVTEDDFMFSSAAGVWIVPLTNLSTGTYSF